MSSSTCPSRSELFSRYSTRWEPIATADGDIVELDVFAFRFPAEGLDGSSLAWLGDCVHDDGASSTYAFRFTVSTPLTHAAAFPFTSVTIAFAAS